eukprot:gene4784-3432_t
MDLVCCAQTGSGKTMAFLVPVVTQLDHAFVRQIEGVESAPVVSIDPHRGALPRAVVLAPTRELASQIQLDARRLTFGSQLKSVCVYGGNDIRAQLQELAGGCDIIVATPGRLNDLVDRGCVSLSQVTFLVLDEADRMLDMGFEPQIRKIVEDYDMPRGDLRQTFMFSATFPSEIQKLARDFLRNYVWIAVGRVGSTVDNIRQQLMLATSDPHKKMELLIQALGHSDGRTLIFVQKKKTATWLCDCLRSMYGVAAEEIHGDRSQSQREYALRMFRDGNIRILVATDVAARGLDVPQVTHVIQFDMPISSGRFRLLQAGEGNGSIAQKLMTLLTENNQEVPEWFAQLDDLQGGRRGHHGGGHQRGRFGYHDTRSNQHNTLYANKGGNNHRGHGGGGDYQHGGGSQYYGGGGGGGGGYQQQSRGGFGGNRGGGGGGMGGYGGSHGGHHGGSHGQSGYPSHQHNANQSESYYAGSGVGAVPGAPPATGGPAAGYVVTSPTSQASGVPPAAPVTSPSAAATGGAGATAAGANPAFTNSGYYDAYSATFVPAGSAAPPAPTVTTPGVPAAPSMVPPAAPDVTPPAAPSLGFDQGAQSWLQQQHQQQPSHMGGYQDRRAGYGGQPQHQQPQHHMGGAGGYQSQYGMGGRGGSGYGGFPAYGQQPQRAAAYGGAYPAAMAQQQPGFYRGGYEGAEDPAAQFQHYQAAQQHYSQVPQQAQVPASYPGVEGATSAVSVGDEAH